MIRLDEIEAVANAVTRDFNRVLPGSGDEQREAILYASLVVEVKRDVKRKRVLRTSPYFLFREIRHETLFKHP